MAIKRKREALVYQHLERVSRNLLVNHSDVVRKFIGRNAGIYALYKKDRLYYVGLASSISVQQVVNSTEYDLFQPLPPEFDLAVMDRFAAYIPGWEMPKNSSEFLTNRYGFITDYLAEAFHYQFKHTNRYEEVSKRIRLGKAIEGRDEKGIKKTVCAFLKILHPNGAPTDDEFEEYVKYAAECRRRVKEQMNMSLRKCMETKVDIFRT